MTGKDATMTDAISLALVGIGGYGNTYVSALLDAAHECPFRIVAGIDPMPSACRRLSELTARSVPIYSSLKEFYATGTADLAVVCSPLQFHAEHTAMALDHGSHVLCEKPLCVTPEQALAMRRARDRAGKQVAIGYQWSFSAAIQQLKGDILDGVFGRAKRLRCLVLWPRDEAYYRRNRWAGAIKDADGNLVLDSPVNNACAHYLHNLLYILGDRVDRAAQPARVTAELYRAHPIENYDTASVRCLTTSGAELLFVVSHATADRSGPIFSYEFERATIDFVDKPGGAIVARFPDGKTKSYGSPSDSRFEKLWAAMQSARDNTATVCGIEAASSHTRCVYAAQQSMPDIRAFPAPLVHTDGRPGSRRTWVDGLDTALQRCYKQFKTPSELGLPWAARGDDITLENWNFDEAAT